MGRFMFIILLVLLGSLQADDSSCDAEPTEEECPCPQERRHVKLFYSGTAPEEHIKEPRGDYEWPGINDSTFYDYFTK